MVKISTKNTNARQLKAQGPSKSPKSKKSFDLGVREVGAVEKLSTVDPDENSRQGFEAAVAELASRVDMEQASDSEMSGVFVDLVLEHRFQGITSGEAGETMRANVRELVEKDPNIVSELRHQLKRLAKK